MIKKILVKVIIRLIYGNNMDIERKSLIVEEYIGKLNQDHTFLHDNDFIHSGYRLYFNTSRKILKSLFMWHNECFNIWSHLLGLLLFVGFLVYISAYLAIPTEISLISETSEVLEISKKLTKSALESMKNAIDSDSLDWVLPSSSNDHLQKISRWPLLVFIISAMICLTLSSMYHLFNAHSDKVYKMMSRLDYAGISILICGSFFPPIYYMYFCVEGSKYLELIIFYLVGISIFCGVVFVVALFPSFQQPKYRCFRGGIFLVLGLTGTVPCVNLIFV